MPKVISIGNQGFEDIRKENRFYVDKTEFIREWWESGDSITLIMRPRRFGKTLNMDMLKCFFSNQYADREDLFEGLTIWKDEKYRSIQGTYPVIYLSFADVKQTNYADAVKKIKRILSDLYQQYVFLLQENCMTEMQKRQFSEVSPQMDDVTAQCALQDLAHYLYRFYGKKVILLLDEYDTPMQEACVYGYWKEFTSFIRSMFNSAFKTNPYLERAVMTGITCTIASLAVAVRAGHHRNLRKNAVAGRAGLLDLYLVVAAAGRAVYLIMRVNDRCALGRAGVVRRQSGHAECRHRDIARQHERQCSMQSVSHFAIPFCYVWSSLFLRLLYGFAFTVLSIAWGGYRNGYILPKGAQNS